MNTPLIEVSNLLRKQGVIPIGVADYIEYELLEKEAKQIINAYYDALKYSSQFEDDDNNEERLQLAIQYYCDHHNNRYLFDKYIHVNEYINR